MRSNRSHTHRSRNSWRWGLLALALLTLIGTLRPPAAHASNITVAAGEVAVSANGQCSLREAIINANNDAATHVDCVAGSGADIITLPSSATFAIADSYASYSGNTGLPQVTTHITVEGNGSTIDRNSATEFRLFAISSAGNLTLNDLTLTDGAVNTDRGGGAVMTDGGTLTINDSTLSGHSGNNSQGGGAIHARGGTTTINRSTLHTNQANNGGGGGAIYADNSATINVTDSTIRNNTATNTSGGGIRLNFTGTNVLNMIGSTVNNNSANSGGGIGLGSGSATITNSTISANTSQANGGGVDGASATLTLNNVTVTGNTAGAGGGGGGGGVYSNTTINLNRSVISGNFGPTGYDSGYELVGNGTENANNYNVFGRGDITNNRAFAYSFTPGANDYLATSDNDGAGPDVATPLANILNTTQANNGGPTNTHALVAGSPAVDLAPSAACAAAPINGVDQRSYPRNVDGNASASANECDAGAVEYLSSPPPTTGDIVIVKEADPADDTPFSFSENITSGGGTFTLTDPADNTETFSNVPTGTYTVTEDGEAGWTLDDITCVDPSNNSTDSGATATINLAAGETVTCTFSNSRDTGTIVIVKDATPEDDTPFSFTEDITGGGTFTLTDPADNTETFSNVPTGTYTVTEDGEAGWTLDDITCVDPSNNSTDSGATATINLAAGETVTCTFSNSKLPPTVPDIFVSAERAGTTGDGVAFGPHDILQWTQSNGWSKWFDGSAAGLMPNGKAKHNINSLWIPDPAQPEVLMSFTQDARFVPGISGKVDGVDLVWWDGSAWSLIFDGQDVGLSVLTKEKIDALHVLDDNAAPPALLAAAGGSCLRYLLISTAGDGQVPNYSGGQIKFDGTDVLGFCQTAEGATTAGKWILVLNGKAEGLPGQALVNLSATPHGQVLYLTTRMAINVDSASGGHSMIYRYDFATGQFSGPYWSAPAEGLSQRVDGLQVDGPVAAP